MSYLRRRVVPVVGAQPEPPLVLDLHVGDGSYSDAHRLPAQFLGAGSGAVEVAAHIADAVRTALQREHPAEKEGGDEVGGLQALLAQFSGGLHHLV